MSHIKIILGNSDKVLSYKWIFSVLIPLIPCDILHLIWNMERTTKYSGEINENFIDAMKIDAEKYERPQWSKKRNTSAKYLKILSACISCSRMMALNFYCTLATFTLFKQTLGRGNENTWKLLGGKGVKWREWKIERLAAMYLR